MASKAKSDRRGSLPRRKTTPSWKLLAAKVWVWGALGTAKVRISPGDEDIARPVGSDLGGGGGGYFLFF